ncbi:MAG: DUF899 family protein [Planctomycetota bacterium]|jgi:predicted dithiol-disulfide oxidoreductase (DUF899 family)
MSEEKERIDSALKQSYAAIREAREQIATLRASRPAEPVSDYEFSTTDGPCSLSDLFGDKDDLMVVHNMGTSCPMCTLWADGFNGVRAHLENRCAFVVSSPDAPDKQAEFAASRGWKLRMVSTEGTSFAKDMGFASDDGDPWPGVSTFQKKDGGVVRVGHAPFGPLDDFSPVFNLMTLFPEGQNDWWPKFEY